jgi:hypothetical protein
MVEIFQQFGLTVEAIDGESNKNGTTAGILHRFKNGETQILCATRGKRFINFVVMRNFLEECSLNAFSSRPWIS